MEKQLNNLIEKITDEFINKEEKDKDELVDKFLKFIMEDTSQEEKRILTRSLLENMSSMKTIRDYIHAENVLLKFYHVLGLSLGVGTALIFIAAILFSDHFLINHLNNFLENLFYFLGFGEEGVDN